MRKSRFTESQILAVLKEQETGKKVSEICREHGITPQTFHRWKSKYGGMDVKQLTKMKELEKELAQYKKMYAELARDNYVLKDVLSKKW